MTATELAKLLGWKRGPLRVKCPVHLGRNLSLQVYSDPHRVGMKCFAGCKNDDILATLGLTWRDLLYNDNQLSTEEKKAWAAKKRADELAEQLQRAEDIRMILQAKPRPRTKDKFELDLEAFTRSVQ